MADVTSHGDPKRSFPNDKKPHICLIGAGISSLRCASTLLQSSSSSSPFKITILESRSRIGGRVAQTKVGTHLIDLGANWIHGTVNNPILDIAKKTGTTWEEADEDAAPVVWDSQGERMKEDVAGQAGGVFWGLIEEAMGYSAEMKQKKGEGEGIGKEEGLYTWLEKKVKERVEDEELRKIVLQMSEIWGNFVGTDIQKQSLRNFWMEEFGEGGNLFLDGTYKKIVDEIARPVLEGEDVDLRLNSKVVKIWGRDGKEGKVKIEVAGGEKLEFDEVVVTCPLGWLKRNLGAFEPPVPERFKEAVESIGYGCLEKILITFPDAFWHGEKDGQETKGMMQWLAPTYAPDQNPNKFMQFSMDYSSMTPLSSHPTLLFYISGSQSHSLIPHLSTLTPSSRKSFLINYCRPYFSRLNNYSADSPACEPVDAVSTGWLVDEDAGYGSYSCFEVGLENGGEDVEVLRRGEGMREKGVWFAGEHTNLKGIGTVRGAYESGEGVGERLKEVYGL